MMSTIEKAVRDFLQALTEESLSPLRIEDIAREVLGPDSVAINASEYEARICAALTSRPNPLRELRMLARLADHPHTTLFTNEAGGAMMSLVTAGDGSADPGVAFDRLEDALVVTEVVSGGPAAIAGLEPGDRIHRVDGDARPP